MSWARLDDQYPDHPKIVEVGPLGMALHTAAICYCARYLTDGFVPAAMISRLINLDGINTTCNGVSHAVSHKEITDELTRVGLFDAVQGGFMVHDYLLYNPPGEQVKAERAANKARQAEFREKRRGNDGKFGSNAGSNANNNALVPPAPSPSPSPSHSKDKEGANAPPPKPAGKSRGKREPKPTIPAEQLRPMVSALGEVTGIDTKITRNYSRLCVDAKDLCLAGYSPQVVRETFGRDGPWYTVDWRGKRNETPTLKAIVETIAQLSGQNNHCENDTHEPTPEELLEWKRQIYPERYGQPQAVTQ